MCAIAYSSENPCGENFIYDFSHYVSKNLINGKILQTDLYGTNGIYTKLKKLNNESFSLIEERVNLSNLIIKAEKEKEVYQALVSELNTSIADAKKDFKIYSGVTYKKFLKKSEQTQKELLELSGVDETFSVIFSQTNKLKDANAQLKKSKNKYNTYYSDYQEVGKKIEQVAAKKEDAIKEFESKYYNFIQEGVWISEEQVDHDVYYIEAKSVAAASAQPKVSYTADVIDVSGLDEFFNYQVDVGDKTFIEDPEFFGYIETSNPMTPKRQEVIIF